MILLIQEHKASKGDYTTAVCDESCNIGSIVRVTKQDENGNKHVVYGEVIEILEELA